MPGDPARLQGPDEAGRRLGAPTALAHRATVARLPPPTQSVEERRTGSLARTTPTTLTHACRLPGAAPRPRSCHRGEGPCVRPRETRLASISAALSTRSSGPSRGRHHRTSPRATSRGRRSPRPGTSGTVDTGCPDTHESSVAFTSDSGSARLRSAARRSPVGAMHSLHRGAGRPASREQVGDESSSARRPRRLALARARARSAAQDPSIR